MVYYFRLDVRLTKESAASVYYDATQFLTIVMMTDAYWARTNLFVIPAALTTTTDWCWSPAIQTKYHQYVIEQSIKSGTIFVVCVNLLAIWSWRQLENRWWFILTVYCICSDFYTQFPIDSCQLQRRKKKINQKNLCSCVRLLSPISDYLSSPFSQKKFKRISTFAYIRNQINVSFNFGASM